VSLATIPNAALSGRADSELAPNLRRGADRGKRRSTDHSSALLAFSFSWIALTR